MNNPQFEPLERRVMGLLDRINVPCKDDGERFLDRARLEAIDACIAAMPQPWRKVHEGPLATVYGGARAPRAGGLLVSTHVDALYDRCSHRHDGVDWIGTFDNSLPSCLLVDALCRGELPDDVLVAFTGDEEDGSRGALEAFIHLHALGVGPGFVLVLDVTAEDDRGRGVTLENLFPGKKNPLPRGREAFQKALRGMIGHPVVTIPEGDPDEAWRYRGMQVSCASLCLPCGPVPGDRRRVGEWMHGDEGFRVSGKAPAAYREALVSVCRGLGRRVSGGAGREGMAFGE